MTYLHTNQQGGVINLPVGKVICVGQNYLDHIKELNNTAPDSALLFMKPSTACCDMRQPIVIPDDRGECHNELELAILIKDTLQKADKEEIGDAIYGVGLALDLTLRDEQNKLRQAGLPWERCKSFDLSCPLSPFSPVEKWSDEGNIKFELEVNGELIQEGQSSMMIRTVSDLITEISQIFTLLPGDVVITGTPKGVGALHRNDRIKASLIDKFSIVTHVVEL